MVTMLTEAAFPPALVGVNTTLNVQFAPEATLAPQLLVTLNSAAFAPVSAMLVIVNVAPPEFVSVTLCAALEV